MKKLLGFLGIVFFSLAFTLPAMASSFGTTYGFSPRGMAMGNAMTAHTDDWASIYYNVAGLGRTQNRIEEAGSKEKAGLNQLSVNYLYTAPSFDLNINRTSSDDGTPLPTRGADNLDFGTCLIGLAMDINTIYTMPDLISSARMGFSMAINDDLTVVKINDVDPRTHNFVRYGREAQRALILAGAGFGFMDDLFGVGLGLNISFGGSGTIAISDLEITEDLQVPVGNAIMDISLEPTAVAGLYVSPGKKIPALEGLEIGFSYRQKSKLKIEPLDTIATLDTGNVLLNMRLSLFDYFQPDIYTVGVSYDFTDKLMVSLELEQQKWSGFDLSDSHKVNFGADLPNLEDILVPKLGTEYRLTDRFALQGGYCFEPTFVPDDATTGIINYLDNDKHIVSVGTSYRLPGFGRMKRDIDLFAAYQHQFLVERDITKTSPTGENPDYSYEGSCSTLYVGITINM
ncbi:hypothetical protein DSLASN_09160 [Desulfoluna limicola]|uniref:Membrane protein involved in aromatic hydrocarbon degradation n=1 Tax=Desulfoluna limicola TaxID=2810562 RepID=A0ABM7PDQ0_9BACT|nr:outer membrane protein transport protein [Desulfoluna limicola]BCS95284.1 hypothetical protein DSLASN_09160 [Desulfoluna limicola]